MSDSNQFIFLAPISYLLTLHHKIFIDETKFRVTEEIGGDDVMSQNNVCNNLTKENFQRGL